MVKACRWHTDWRGQGKSVHPEPLQPACLDEMTWPFGRTLRTSDPGGMMRLYGLYKTVSLGALSCRGGHWSRRYRRLWSRRGTLRLLAFFAKVEEALVYDPPLYNINKNPPSLNIGNLIKIRKPGNPISPMVNWKNTPEHKLGECVLRTSTIHYTSVCLQRQKYKWFDLWLKTIYIYIYIYIYH